MSASCWTTIGEIAEVFDGPHATPTKTDSGPVFLSISSLENGHLDLSKSAHLSEEDFIKWTRRVTPREGDVLFSYETRLGDAALMPPNLKACLGRRMGLLRPKLEKVVPEYLLYAYLSPEFQEVIRSKTVHGATVDRLALKEIPSFPIFIPSLKEQQRTVNVLKSLNDKIELNRQTNQTLEQIAQALFKSWFVDFEPTRAKIAAKEAGASPEEIERAAMCAISGKTPDQLAQLPTETQQNLKTTAALFPDVLVDSELGEVPAGWKVKAMGKYVEIKRGGSPRPIQDFMSETGFPWTKISDATAEASPFLFRTKEFIKEEGLKKTVLLKKGTLILSNSATPGLPKFLELDACIHDGWLYFPSKSHFSDIYLFHLFLVLKESFISQGNGSIFTNLKTDILRNQTIVIPPLQLLQKFDSIANHIFSVVRGNCKETIGLMDLRDSLLPKLLSGEIQLQSNLEGTDLDQSIAVT